MSENQRIAQLEAEIERLERRIKELEDPSYIDAKLQAALADIRCVVVEKDEIERLRTDKDQLIAIAADEMRKRDAEIKRLRAMLRDRPRDDGTVVAVGGEPGASAGKSE